MLIFREALLHNNAFNNISSSPYICLAILDLNLYAYIGINKKYRWLKQTGSYIYTL